MNDEQERPGETPEDKLIREIREDYTYARDFWRENYQEAKTDLQFVGGDPWDTQTRRQREDNDRPVLSPDELSQYLNATINNLRQSPRSIKVTPAGEDAEDKNAEQRSAIIKGIEYKSNAQSAYTNAFECAINCGFGFFRVTTKKISKDGDVEPRIKIIENPLSVLMDPNAKEADYSDQKRCFVLDVIRQTDFERRYPKAQKRSFSPQDAGIAAGWLEGQNIMIAEYWRIDGYDEDGEGGTVTQYVTNGFEILSETDWPGSRIPIVPVLGKKMYIPQGDQMRRMYYSMVRLARPCQKMLAYIASQEAEEYGMAPRAPIMGYTGQFETDEDAWDNLNKVPRSRIQVDPVVDQATNQLLPLPTRLPFTPNYAAYEAGYERWRRSLQAAMGITPLPTAAQRENEKSGVALSRIETQQAIGSFHFTDNFDRSLENAGRQINELITEVMDTERQVAVRNPDETHSLMKVVPGGISAPAMGADGEPSDAQDEVFDPQAGAFDVTISTGPSYQSQREEASATADLLLQESANLPIAPPQKASLISLSIKMKNLGPLGDEMAKIIDPQGDGEPVPPQAQQMIAQLQQQLQQSTQAAQQLAVEKQGKAWETQGKLQQIQAQSQADMALEDKKLQTQIAVAEINTKAQILSERQAALNDLEAQLHQQAHELGLQKDAQTQAQQMQEQQAQSQSAQSAQDAAQQQQTQPAAPEGQ